MGAHTPLDIPVLVPDSEREVNEKPTLSFGNAAANIKQRNRNHVGERQTRTITTQTYKIQKCN